VCYGRGMTEIGKAAWKLKGVDVPAEVVEDERRARERAVPHVAFYCPLYERDVAAGGPARALLHAFFRALCLCHDAVPEYVDDGATSSSSSSNSSGNVRSSGSNSNLGNSSSSSSSSSGNGGESESGLHRSPLLPLPHSGLPLSHLTPLSLRYTARRAPCVSRRPTPTTRRSSAPPSILASSSSTAAAASATSQTRPRAARSRRHVSLAPAPALLPFVDRRF